MKKIRYLMLLAVMLLSIITIAGCATETVADKPENGVVEQEKITLTAVSSFAQGAPEHLGFWIFVDKLEEIAGDFVEIDYRGGPEVFPPLEQAEALSQGIIDMVTGPEAYWPHLVPEATAFKMTTLTPWEEREIGLYDLFNEAHQEQLNAYYLLKTMTGSPYHLFTNVLIETADFSGITMRSSATYQRMIEALGGGVVSIGAGEIHSALERGVVDGFGWAGIGVTGFGWHEVTDYEIYPGLGNASTITIVNLDKWNSIPGNVQSLIIEAAEAAEYEIHERYIKLYEEERAERREAGVETIEFTGAEKEKFLQTWEEEGWKEVIEKSPNYGPQLQELMTQ